MALSEGVYPGDWLKWEEGIEKRRARTVKTILAGSGSSRVLTNGMVVSEVTMGAATPAAVAGNTGNGVLGAVTLTQGAKLGVYRLVLIEPATNVGEFTVTGPDGISLLTGTVAVAYSDGGLAFTLADGATDFVAGDEFTITVAAGSNKVVQYDENGVSGSQTPVGILFADITALDAVDNPDGVVITGRALVRELSLVWPGTADAGEKAAAVVILRSLGIKMAAGE